MSLASLLTPIVKGEADVLLDRHTTGVFELRNDSLRRRFWVKFAGCHFQVFDAQPVEDEILSFFEAPISYSLRHLGATEGYDVVVPSTISDLDRLRSKVLAGDMASLSRVIEKGVDLKILRRALREAGESLTVSPSELANAGVHVVVSGVIEHLEIDSASKTALEFGMNILLLRILPHDGNQS